MLLHCFVLCNIELHLFRPWNHYIFLWFPSLEETILVVNIQFTTVYELSNKTLNIYILYN